MSIRSNSLFLRRVLLSDAAISGATGALMWLGAGQGEGLLRLPPELLQTAGLALLPFAALVAWLALRPTLSRAGVWIVIACNAMWAIDCIVLMLAGWVTPNAFGVAFLLLQALAVAALAELEYLGLKRVAPRLAGA